MENTASFSPSVVSLLLTSGARRCYVVDAYVPPNDRPIVHRMEQALKAAPMGLELILMGDLNARLGNLHDESEEEIATAPADQGLVNMKNHFLTSKQYWGAGGCTWIIQRDRTQVMGG